MARLRFHVVSGEQSGAQEKEHSRWAQMVDGVPQHEMASHQPIDRLVRAIPHDVWQTNSDPCLMRNEN